MPKPFTDWIELLSATHTSAHVRSTWVDARSMGIRINHQPTTQSYYCCAVLFYLLPRVWCHDVLKT